MSKLANQPAFARPNVWTENHGLIFGAYGMTLRQYYAGQMMAAIIAADAKALDNPSLTANDAVMMAEALLAALGEGGAA